MDSTRQFRSYPQRVRYRDSEGTAKAFEGGWFHTGDLAVLHSDGYVEIKDRAKHIIISGGEKISTLEVERALSSHPSVLEVAVVPIPHDRWGEVPKAFVVLKPHGSGARLWPAQKKFAKSKMSG